MALSFGTSGVRGLVTEMTDAACYGYAVAFARLLDERGLPLEVALARPAATPTACPSPR